MSKQLKSKIAQYALGTVVVLIAVPAYLEIKHVRAEPDGSACTATTTCRGNHLWSSGMCLSGGEAGGYCTHECSATSDCSDGLSCEEVDGTWTTETTRGNHASQRQSTTGAKLVCVKK